MNMLDIYKIRVEQGEQAMVAAINAMSVDERKALVQEICSGIGALVELAVPAAIDHMVINNMQLAQPAKEDAAALLERVSKK